MTVDLARRAILELIDHEHVLAPQEIEAKLCERMRLDLMDVRLARDDLEVSGQILRSRGRARDNGRELPLFMSRSHEHAAERATVAEHKRELLARYLAWGEDPSGPIRSAADLVVHASFQLASRSGYRIGPSIPSDVVIYAPIGEGSLPDQPILLPIEVKNTREWLMPHSRDLYQLLIKATRIQVSEHAVPMVPMFVCRRADPSLTAMGRDLGFLVLETRREFILPSVAETAVAEVRATLGFTDLTRTGSPDSLMVSWLEHIVPGLTAPLVARWQRTVTTTIPLRFAELAEESMLAGRRRILRSIRAIADSSGLTEAASTW